MNEFENEFLNETEYPLNGEFPILQGRGTGKGKGRGSGRGGADKDEHTETEVETQSNSEGTKSLVDIMQNEDKNQQSEGEGIKGNEGANEEIVDQETKDGDAAAQEDKPSASQVDADQRQDKDDEEAVFKQFEIDGTNNQMREKGKNNGGIEKKDKNRGEATQPTNPKF